MSNLEYTFFTPPYPEECLYSVVARYHVRSANPTLSASVRELFPESCGQSLCSTVTSPYMLTYMDQWMSPEFGYSRNRLISETTSYQLHVVSLRKTPFVSEIEEQRKQHLQNRLIHPHRHLRYCPHCVREQFIVYGEPYWQRLPQLWGAEYCPIHGIPYVDSEVSVRDIRYRAIPASFVLPCEPQAPKTQIDSRLEECYISASRDLLWLLQNGYCVKGMERSVRTAEIALGLRRNGLWARVIEEKALDIFPEKYVYECFPCFRNKMFKYDYYTMHGLRPRQIAALMSITSGSAESFARLRKMKPLDFMDF